MAIFLTNCLKAEHVVNAGAIRFDIIDLKDGCKVGSAKTRARANVSADKRNQQYGAHRYSVQAVYQ